MGKNKARVKMALEANLLNPIVRRIREREKENLKKQHESDSQRLISAALACAELAERQMEHERRTTRIMQESFKLSSSGNKKESEAKLAEANLLSAHVFNFSEVHAELVDAARALKNSNNST